MTTSTLASYDEIPYPGDPVLAMHPDRLAALGRLHGLPTPSPERCRVLELGCCDGGNLIPLALVYPDSTFVGVDLSERQIASGMAEVSSLGIANLDLRHASILDVRLDWGPFDFVLAHGVYSWVPPEVRARILTLARDHLTPNGVAFVSYNTYPGWATSGILRSALLFAARQETTGVGRVARARSALTFLARGLAADRSSYAEGLRGLVEEQRKRPDHYIAHEYLEENNDPIWFQEFVAAAEGAGLRFLCESNLPGMDAALLPPEAQQALADFTTDRLSREQGMDLLRNRRFRQTLLCRRECAVSEQIDPTALEVLWVSSEARRAERDQPEPVTFALAAGGSLTTTEDALIKTFDTLEAAWPGAVLAATLPVSPEKLLECLTRGLVEVHTSPPRSVRDPGAFPRTSAWARRQAERGAIVTDLRHRLTELDSTERLLFQRLDGQSDRAALVAWLEERVQRGKIVFTEGPLPEGEALRLALGEIVDLVLRNLTRQALLMGSSSS
jgi:SAM-dependent methyltransferase